MIRTQNSKQTFAVQKVEKQELEGKGWVLMNEIKWRSLQTDATEWSS